MVRSIFITAASFLCLVLLACGGRAPQMELPKTGLLRVPLYGLFEQELTNSRSYKNPFTDVILNAQFTAPSGRVVKFWGFYDGQDVWRQRFMPDEAGNWFYTLSFSDGAPGASGSFVCVEEGAFPGPWKQDPDNPRWLQTSLGEHFLRAQPFFHKAGQGETDPGHNRYFPVKPHSFLPPERCSSVVIERNPIGSPAVHSVW